MNDILRKLHETTPCVFKARKKTAIIAGCVAAIVIAAAFFPTIYAHQLSSTHESDKTEEGMDARGSSISSNSAADQKDAEKDPTSAGTSATDACQPEGQSVGEPAATEPTEADNGAVVVDQGRAAISDSAENPAGAESNSPGESQKTWIEDTERIWVVDRAAWVETVPVYENVEKSICNICGADITGNTSAHGKQHMLAGEGSGYHSEIQQEKTGEKTVAHSEKGHWETITVGGHWE